MNNDNEIYCDQIEDFECCSSCHHEDFEAYRDIDNVIYLGCCALIVWLEKTGKIQPPEWIKK